MARPPAQSERVYSELRDALTRGELPIGGRLVEQQLAARFGTSRTPVREALRRLEGDGHLTRDASGALQPRIPSVRSMRELYDVRIVLEELTARRAALTGDRGQLEALEQDWRTLRPAGGTAFVHHDEAFHERLAQASGNHVATGILQELNGRIRILRIHDFTRPERIRATIAEHLEILGAVLLGDADGAASFMHAHVQRSAAEVRERIGEVLARMVEE